MSDKIYPALLSTDHPDSVGGVGWTEKEMKAIKEYADRTHELRSQNMQAVVENLRNSLSELSEELAGNTQEPMAVGSVGVGKQLIDRVIDVYNRPNPFTTSHK